MLQGLDAMMNFQTTALALRGRRQELLAANIANADTPNYKAVDFDFAAALSAATQGAQAGAGRGTATPETLFRVPSQAALDGNSVEMDAERAHFADNAVRHEAAMRFLTAQIKTMLAAVQG